MKFNQDPSFIKINDEKAFIKPYIKFEENEQDLYKTEK